MNLGQNKFPIISLVLPAGTIEGTYNKEAEVK